MKLIKFKICQCKINNEWIDIYITHDLISNEIFNIKHDIEKQNNNIKCRILFIFCTSESKYLK